MEVNVRSSISHDWNEPPLDTNHNRTEPQVVCDYDQPNQPFLTASDIRLFIEKIESDFEEKKYDQVLKDLSTLVVHYGAQSGISTEEIQTAYAFVKRLIPHLEVGSLNKFIDQLTDFLIKTKTFPKEHLAVANLIGTQYVRHKNGKAAMHYFAKALVIARRYNLKEEESLNSPLFLSCIFQDKVKRVFQNAINKAVGNNDPQLFKAQLDRIRDLQAFCHPNDFPCIRSLYEQAQQAISDINSQRRGNFSPLLGAVIQGLTQPFLLPKELPLEKYRNALDDFRAQFDKLYKAQQNILDPKGVRHLQREVTQHFKRLFKVFLTDIFTILGEPPFDYDFRAMGSLGREEMCPYSDLEWFALVSDLKFQSDITMIAELLELQVISLGETNLENPVCFSSVPLKSGLHIDIGGNPARTKQNQNLSLIGTPADLAREQTPSAEDQMVAANDTTSTMRKSASLASKGNLIEQYERESRDILVSPLPEEEITPFYKTVGERRAIRFLEKHLEDFKAMWKGPPEGLINLKTQYVELINHLMTTLALFYNLSETNTLDILDRLTEKEVFTPRSGQLLKERIAGLYMIRVRSHLFHEEQKEEVRFEELNRAEQDLLVSTYWLVLQPLYHLIEKWLETEKPMIQADLLDIAVEQMIADLSSSIKRQFFFNRYIEVISLIASFIGSTEDSQLQHLKVYKKLSQFSKFEPLREAYLNWVDRQTLEALLEIPNSAGLRRAYIKEYQSFEQVFTSLLTDQAFPDAVKVTTTFLDRDKEYYFKPEVAEAILKGGRIKREYSNSAHDVVRYQGAHVDFYFKRMPSHPLMEYAMHSLTSRIMGKGTPPVHLIRLDGKAGPYPVLVSETIPGKTLGEESPPFDLKHLTWMLLCQVITHPGDGRPPNFVVDDKGRIFCVDNDVSLIEAVVDKTVYFASTLFCLKEQIDGQEREILTTSLDEEVIKQFCHLDVFSILWEWLEEVIEKETQALTLFEEEERKKLFKEDPRNLTIFKWRSQEDQQKLFTPHILFQKGAIASLYTQFLSLQKTLSEKKTSITPLDLLNSLTTLGKKITDSVNIGKQVIKAYTKAQKGLTLEARYKLITGRNQSMSQVHSQTIIYGKPPKLEEIEKGKVYSPTQAREELLVTNIVWMGNVQVDQAKEAFSLKADFSNIKQENLPDIERQGPLLNGLPYWIKLYHDHKLCQIHITYCGAINDENLLPLLHPDLQVLNLTGCSGISNAIVLQIEKNCPKLQELYLSGTDITAFASPNLLGFNLIAIAMPQLQTLHLSRCLKLDTIRLNTPLLGELKAEKSAALKWIEFSDLYTVEVAKESKATISLKNRANLKISPFMLATYEKATIGDALAQSNLAICFDTGNRVSQSYQKAFFWYQKSAKSYSKSQLRLAQLYFNGQTVARDLDQAIYWSHQAAPNEVEARRLLIECSIETPANLDHITDLDLRNCLDVTDQVLESLVKKCPNLINLNLGECHKITDGGLAHLKTLNDLQQLNLESCYNITDRGLAHLKALNDLQQLNLSECRQITDGGLAHLQTLNDLQQLNLSGCSQITDGGLAHLQPLTQLQHLNLSGEYYDLLRIPGASLPGLQMLAQSQCLDITRITDAGLAHLQTLTQLQHLNLLWCFQITDGGLAHLKTLTRLQHLNLSWCFQITDGGLAHLKTLNDLQQLNLSKCHQITDAGLAHLKMLNHLTLRRSVGWRLDIATSKSSLI